MGELPRTEHPAHNALLKAKKKPEKKILLSPSKEKLLSAEPGQAVRSRGEWEARKAGEHGLQRPTRWLPAPWRHFFSSLLPPPPPTILKRLCMSHTPTSKHKAPCISLFHAHPSRFYFQEVTRIWGLHTRDTQVYMLPLPDNSCEMSLALPLLGSRCPMPVCCMVGESKTNPSATLTSPPANSLR